MSRALALLMERFPMLALEASAFPIGCACSDDLSHWPKALLDWDILYIYGLSIEAYEKIKPWLHAEPKRKVIFLENQEPLIGAFLASPNNEEFLQDPQLELHKLPSGRVLSASLEALAEANPASSLDIFSLPSRAGSYFRSLRLKLLRKTTLSHAVSMDRLHGYQLFSNFLKGVTRLKNSFYLNAMKGSLANIPAVICGAGPSLTAALPLLATFENKAVLLGCGSAITALSHAGTSPHFCIAVDPNEEEFRRLKQSTFFEVPFLYSTRLHPHVFSTVNGPFGYLRSQFGDVLQLWIEEELGLKDPLIGHYLSSESISVTSMAVAAAEFLGCNPIVLVGLDMAYTKNQRYASSVHVSETPKDVSKKTSLASDRLLIKKDQKGKKVYSAVRWVMESSSLSQYAKLHPQTRFINATEGGIGFKTIPFVPLEKIAEEFVQEYDLRGLIHAETSLAPLARTISVRDKIQELKESLIRIIDHLSILAGEKKGVPILAELDLQEELAFSVLFYDVFRILPHADPSRYPEEKWNLFLDLAKKYLAVIPK